MKSVMNPAIFILDFVIIIDVIDLNNAAIKTVDHSASCSFLRFSSCEDEGNRVFYGGSSSKVTFSILYYIGVNFG